MEQKLIIPENNFKIVLNITNTSQHTSVSLGKTDISNVEIEPYKTKIAKFYKVEWPEIRKGKKTELRQYFDATHKNLIQDLNRKIANTNMGKFYRIKTAIKILEHDLSFIRETEQKFIDTNDRTQFLNSISDTFFKDKKSIKETLRSLNNTMDTMLLPKIKEDKIDGFQALILRKLKKYELHTITLRTINEAVVKALEIMLENPSQYFEYGSIYNKYDLEYIRKRIRKDSLQFNACYISCITLINGILSEHKQKEELKQQQKENNNFSSKNITFSQRKEDYSLKVKTKKEDFIPKIKRSYQDDANKKLSYELESIIDKYKDDNDFPDEYEIQEDLMEKFKKEALEKTYEYYEKFKKIAFKENVILKEKKTKIDKQNRVKEFINLFYIDTPKDIHAGTHTCDLHKCYEEWMTSTYPEENITSIVSFGRILANVEIMERKLERYSDGKKQGWRLCIKK